jgi:hypothetical protein
MRRRSTLRASRAGFTILEIILAMGILLFGMAAILGMLTMGAALTRTAELRTQAASATAAVVADLEETFFPLVDGEPGDPVPIVERALPGSDGVVYSARGTRNPARPLEWRVDVELAWTSAGVRRERAFSTLLLQELPFGERLRRQFVEGKPVAPPERPATAPGPTDPAPKR